MFVCYPGIMQWVFRDKLTWCCNDGSVTQLVALLIFSAKVTDAKAEKKDSSRNSPGHFCSEKFWKSSVPENFLKYHKQGLPLSLLLNNKTYQHIAHVLSSVCLYTNHLINPLPSPLEDKSQEEE